MIPPLGIILPTRWEARDVLKRFGRDPRAAILISGVGHNAATRASYALCDRGVSGLVSAGFCGAVDPALRVGDALDSRVATVEKPLTSPKARAAFRENSNAIAVDMETRAIIEAGTLRGVPIFIRRVVSDTAGDDLSPLLGEGEPFSSWRIGLRLLNPGTWSLARRLAAQSRVASVKVADLIGELLTALP